MDVGSNILLSYDGRFLCVFILLSAEQGKRGHIITSIADIRCDNLPLYGELLSESVVLSSERGRMVN